jgi:eukaryotic-like serine/threonine-protein kinase
MSLDAGTRLGPYEIVSRLGAGAMGEVYCAKHVKLQRRAAIKILSTEFAADPERLKRFETEARAASALNHPNIVAIYDIDDHEGIPYIAMELVEGQTLRDRLNAGRLDTRDTLAIATQIAEGLAAAHDAGIFHRDLKPENVMVTPDGRVKIVDFGSGEVRCRPGRRYPIHLGHRQSGDDAGDSTRHRADGGPISLVDD